MCPLGCPPPPTLVNASGTWTPDLSALVLQWPSVHERQFQRRTSHLGGQMGTSDLTPAPRQAASCSPGLRPKPWNPSCPPLSYLYLVCPEMLQTKQAEYFQRPFPLFPSPHGRRTLIAPPSLGDTPHPCSCTQAGFPRGRAWPGPGKWVGAAPAETPASSLPAETAEEPGSRPPSPSIPPVIPRSHPVERP